MAAARAGDEYAQTRSGNNNWYGHDTKMTRFDWDALEEQRDTFFRFYRCAPPILFRLCHWVCSGKLRLGRARGAARHLLPLLQELPRPPTFLFWLRI